MKIMAVNGSPKADGGISKAIIGQIENLLNTKIETVQTIPLTRNETLPETMDTIFQSEILLIVFPLYVDSLPAPLIELLTRLEKAADQRKNKPRIFTIVNCGFFESHQTALAIDMIRHFATRVGFPWGCGVGIGGGGMLKSMSRWEKGPASGVYHALKEMAVHMQNGTSGETLFAAPKFPRFLYMFMAQWGMWSDARKNGVKNVRARPYS